MADGQMWYRIAVIVMAGDWSIRYSELSERFAVSCAGNFRGWFNGPDEIKAAFPFPRGHEMADKLRHWQAEYDQVKLMI